MPSSGQTADSGGESPKRVVPFQAALGGKIALIEVAREEDREGWIVLASVIIALEQGLDSGASGGVKVSLFEKRSEVQVESLLASLVLRVLLPPLASKGNDEDLSFAKTSSA